MLPKAPAVQLAETAQAVLEDDKRLGIQRADPFIDCLGSAGSKHAVTWMPLMVFSLPKTAVRNVLYVVTTAGKAEKTFAALDAQAMRAPVHVTRVSIGELRGHPLLLPRDFVLGLNKLRKPPVLLPHEDLAKTRATLTEFWARWKALYGADHGIFQKVSGEDLSLCLPVKLHGDEGRSTVANYIYGFLFFVFFKDGW